MIEQTYEGENEVRIILDENGKAFICLDDLIICCRAWANANKNQPAMMGLLREVIKLRNKNQAKQ